MKKFYSDGEIRIKVENKYNLIFFKDLLPHAPATVFSAIFSQCCQSETTRHAYQLCALKCYSPTLTSRPSTSFDS